MIRIVDSIMGSGKTTWAIGHMNQHPEKHYLYITPYLDEAMRIAEACPKLGFLQPEEKPYSKTASFHTLLAEGKNIALSHELFSRLKITGPERILIREYGYTLILDEALQVVKPLKITRSDIRKLLVTETIEYDEDSLLVTWRDTEYSGLFGQLKRQVQSGNVRFMDESLLLWVFSKETLEAFPDVYVLTYLFDGSLMRYYLDVCGMTYEFAHIDFGALISGKGDDKGVRAWFKELLIIEESEKRNAIGNPETALSRSWYEKQSKDNRKIPFKNAYNVLHNSWKASVRESMYTSYKDTKERRHMQRYEENAFVKCNCRATNVYRDCWALAYLINVYVHPYVLRWFERQGVKIDQEAYALEQMVQWIWRSAIRDRKKVKLYIPSSRMRRLLKQWLGWKEINQTKMTSKMKSKVRIHRTLRH